jgi:hypothetical protein
MHKVIDQREVDDFLAVQSCANEFHFAFRVSVPADLRAHRSNQRYRERKARSGRRCRHIDGLPDVHNRIGKIDRANRRGLAKRGAAAGVADL